MSWNLAFGQYTQLPAFHGYLNQAQENLIRKHIDRKTWNYWQWESLWGNFEYEKNPIRTDNIMLSGFLGVSLGLFETVVCLGKTGPILERAHCGERIGESYGTSTFYAGTDHREAA